MRLDKPHSIRPHTGSEARLSWGESPPRPAPPRPLTRFLLPGAGGQVASRPTLPSGALQAAPCCRAMSTGWFRRRFLPGGPLPGPRPPRPRTSPLPYRRPRFLRGSGSCSSTADTPHRPEARPVRCPARGRALPWNAGYAE